MGIPDAEDLFRYIRPQDCDWREDGTARLRQTLFSQSTPVSMNRGSVWDEAQNLQVAPVGIGLCAVTAGAIRGVWNRLARPESGLDVLPCPLSMTLSWVYRIRRTPSFHAA